MNEFKVNEYITLKLEDGNTNIYVNGRLFQQCKFLLLNIPVDGISSFDEIKSIDEAAEKLDRSLEGNDENNLNIPPDVEFWGHCSNIQVWVENNYSTNLLHRNLAFPLLRKLYEVNDPDARKVFREEIVRRIQSGYPSVFSYLIEEDYLRYLSIDELITTFYNIDDLPPNFKRLVMDSIIKSAIEVEEIFRKERFVDFLSYYGDLTTLIKLINLLKKYTEFPLLLELAKAFGDKPVHKEYYFLSKISTVFIQDKRDLIRTLTNALGRLLLQVIREEIYKDKEEGYTYDVKQSYIYLLLPFLEEFFIDIISGIYSFDYGSVIENLTIFFEMLLIVNEFVDVQIDYYLNQGGAYGFYIDTDFDGGIEFREYYFGELMSDDVIIDIKDKKMHLSFQRDVGGDFEKDVEDFNNKNGIFELNPTVILLYLSSEHKRVRKRALKYLENLDIKDLGYPIEEYIKGISQEKKVKIEKYLLKLLSSRKYIKKKLAGIYLGYFNRKFLHKDYLQIISELTEETKRKIISNLMYKLPNSYDDDHKSLQKDIEILHRKAISKPFVLKTEKEELHYVIFKDQWKFIKDNKLDLSYRKIKSLSEIQGLGAASNLKILNLASNDLESVNELLVLNQLEELNLESNKLTSLKGFEKLINLQKINLRRNQVEDYKILGLLSNIKEINLTFNKITRIENFKNFGNLQVLSLGRNNISKLECLEKEINIKKLELNNNRITKIEGLTQLINLEELNLSFNQISEIRGLEGLVKLKKLNLSKNKIKELKGLDRLINLTDLYIYRNSIQEMKGFDNLDNLIKLIISSNQIAELKELNKLRNLAYLAVNDNDLSEIKGLENLVNLKTLFIGKNKISENLIKDLGGWDYYKNEVNDPQQFVEYCYIKFQNLEKS